MRCAILSVAKKQRDYFAEHKQLQVLTTHYSLMVVRLQGKLNGVVDTQPVYSEMRSKATTSEASHQRHTAEHVTRQLR